MKPNIRRLAAFLPLFLTTSANAAIAINLPGNTETAGWQELGTSFAGNTWTADGFPTAFPLADNPWPSDIAPNAPGSTSSATFGKSSGGGYFASTSIYNAGSPGTHFLTNASPIAGISTLVVQFDLGSPLADAPVFTYNGGTAGPAPEFALTAAGKFTSGFTGEPAPTTIHAWQWDLSDIPDPITDWNLDFSTAPHGTIYEMRLDSGDTFAQVIPEPGTAAIASLAILTLLRRRR